MKAFVLVWNDTDNSGTRPIAVYAAREPAEAEAQKLEREYADTNPAFHEWCMDRWEIVEGWRRTRERPLTEMDLPLPEGEAEVREMIGPCPELRGHESCDVYEVENRMSETAQ